MADSHKIRERDYTLEEITGFVRSQCNLAQASTMTTEQAKLVGSVSNAIDLFYHFTDDEQQTPALGFRQIRNEQQEERYLIIYLDPSLTHLWK